jgi:putative ABC transport system substrate-binding protein
MTRRRKVLIAFGVCALAAPVTTFAQLQRVYRIGYLANDPDRSSPTFQAFVGAMRELGWIEGKNIDIRFQTSRGRDELFPNLAAVAAREDVDVIVTTGSASTRAAKAATNSIPIVFGSAANPVEQKFVASLARPGGNVTGLALLVQELGLKRLQFMKEMLPRASRFARLYQASSLVPIQPAIIGEAEAVARTLGITIQHIPVTHFEDIEVKIAEVARSRIDAIDVTAAALFVVNRDWIAKLALKYRLPLMGPDGRFADAGALISYGENFASRYQRAAFMVDKILRGTKPAEIPVEQPVIFEFVVNLKTAKALGMVVPDLILLQAGRVIQ